MNKTLISWTEGSQAQLIDAIRAMGLDPEKHERWRWDPRPSRVMTPGTTLPAAGTAFSPCPFLMEDRSLLEAHAEWVKEGKTHRLLVVPARGGGLRWAWHEIENQGGQRS